MAEEPEFSCLAPYNNGIAPCKVRFLIIGGGIAGLSAAIALRRVGHFVTVLEADDGLSRADLSHGCRMPPNMCKIYYHWDMTDELHEISVKSEGVIMRDLSTSETLGIQIWREEMLEEARAEFEFTSHHKLRRLLHDKATAMDVEIRYNCPVKSVNPGPRSPSVTLESGEVVKGDVLVGADGPRGVTRPLVLTEEDEPHDPGHLAMFNTTVPTHLMMQDPELATLFEGDVTHLHTWFGNNHAALGYTIGDEFALHIYAPSECQSSQWGDSGSKSELASFVSLAEPRLRKLVALAAEPTKVSCLNFHQVDEWVHPDGKLVVIGDAVHPLTPGGLQSLAMGVEDGAVLARLFSHLPRKSSIPSFLFAFQDTRRDRCTSVRETEQGNLNFMAMPPGDIQMYRDAVMQRKLAEGKNALDPDTDLEDEEGGGEAHNEWMAIMRIFCYDAEDEADGWWVEWGMLRERSSGIHIPTVTLEVDWKEYDTDESDSEKDEEEGPGEEDDEEEEDEEDEVYYSDEGQEDDDEELHELFEKPVRRSR